MDSGNKKTQQPKSNSKSKSKSKSSNNNDISSYQIDADAELALALSKSDDASLTDDEAVLAFVDDTKFEQQQHIIHLKQQEEADAEYARQLADEFDAPRAQASASTNTVSRDSDDRDDDSDRGDRYDGGDGDDMDTVLEEIANMEAQDRLKASGHAYNAKTNISRILADEDEEEDRIRDKVMRDSELHEWREERLRQDADFAAAAEHDRLLELSKKAIETSISEHKPQSTHVSELQKAPEFEPTPLTKEELRRARLAFFTPTNLMRKS